MPILKVFSSGPVGSWPVMDLGAVVWESIPRVVMNLGSIHSCGIREPINFSSESEVVHAKHGGIGQSQSLEKVHEGNVALARGKWSHGGALRSSGDSKTTCHVKVIQESVARNRHVGKSRCQKEAADPNSSCRPCMVARRNCPRRVVRTL